MSVNIQKLKKWTNMLLGKSSYHVNQNEGLIYSKTEIKGYYNNLTEKVTRFGLEGNQIPTTVVDSGEELYFSIAIFQYGLAAYDLYLLNNDVEMAEKTLACAEWAVTNQQQDGSWVTFFYENKEHPYSSMAQGEGISLLLRAYQIKPDDRYLTTAKLALEFMLIPKENGGTTKYDGEDVYFYECTEDPLILNGWIFSLWGVMDYYKFFKDEKAKKILDATLISLEKKLPDFDLGYWSMYEDGMRICSPFYHSLHIAQLNVMYELTGNIVYSDYAGKFSGYQRRWINRKRAFITKAFQKVFRE